MLRDVLTSLPGVCTWPCDEINYLWRHANAARPDDELLPEHATPRVQAYIRRCFLSLSRRTNARWIVEKTCANSLRVGFVDRILPDAKFIFLVRDGRDAAASAVKRWTAPSDWGYLARKARYVPIGDLPRSILRYASNLAHRFLSAERRLASWGPRFRNMDTLLANSPLADVCAAQWERCVSKAQTELAELEPSRVIHVKYERFVAEPQSEIEKVLDFLRIHAPLNAQRSATDQVTDRNVGKWRSALDPETLSRIAPTIDPQLVALGYQPCTTTMQTACAA